LFPLFFPCKAQTATSTSRPPPTPSPTTKQCSIYILTDYGRPTGVALVEFASPQDAAAALAKDKQMMGSRYIEVFPSTRDDLQRNLGRCY
jgi:heterogeneous nuclear ribonucleoprotein F/H